jgi:GntR family transcriptional regulator
VFTDRPDVPKWRQLAELLRDRIEAGEYQPRHPIPSEHALVSETGLSRSTVRKAVGALKEDHWVYSVHGLGVFVAMPEARR